MSSSAYEGLEVAPDEGLQLPREGLEVVDPGVPEAIGYSDEFTKSAASEPVIHNARTVCGVRKTIFWSIFAVVLICIIVGGVVGGIEGSKHSTERYVWRPEPPTSHWGKMF